MNRWKFLFSGAALLVGFFGVLMVSSAGVRQRSDGCGPHPLIVLAAASRPFGNIIIIHLSQFRTISFRASPRRMNSSSVSVTKLCIHIVLTPIRHAPISLLVSFYEFCCKFRCVLHMSKCVCKFQCDILYYLRNLRTKM
jgi:hypothetical protein